MFSCGDLVDILVGSFRITELSIIKFTILIVFNTASAQGAKIVWGVVKSDEKNGLYLLPR